MIGREVVSPAKIFKVSDLNRMVREMLESSFPLFWISGEISNFTRAASGHWYFSLKDAHAQVKCVMFKGRNSYVDFLPHEGMQIEARASVTLYEAKGDFQLTIEFLQQAGLGRLYEAFENLKQKLQNEGLFDPSKKKRIPTQPAKIGIVTSPDAAALRDVLTTLKRRYPSIPVIVYPAPVQGKGAAALIAKAIETASQRDEVQTLIICRGGGSIEDLWSFNEEVVARAIADCNLPVISGVGHETDFTIADFVADLRAATPTAAAELACPDRVHRLQQIVDLQNQLKRGMLNRLQQNAQELDYLSRRLISPAQGLKQQQSTLQQLQVRMRLAMQNRLHSQVNRMQNIQVSLNQLNPLNVLARGYAIVQKQDGTAVRQARQLELQETLKVILDQGTVEVVVSKC